MKSEVEAKSDSDDQEEGKEDEFKVRNFMTEMYANDEFLKIKEEQEQQIQDQIQLEVEQKFLISQMDEVLGDLSKWRRDQQKLKPKHDKVGK